MEILYLPVSRVLNGTEAQLFSYLGNEREAVALAKVISLPEHATYAQIETAVVMALVATKEKVSGPAHVEYLGGQRRDLIRKGMQ